jgi:ribonuclease-3
MLPPESVAKLQEIIGYEFKNADMLLNALCHPGSHKSNKKLAHIFERLEFLGDRVLGLALSDFLYKKFPLDTNADLAVRISSLAGTNFLIEIVQKTQLLECLSLPKDFFVSGKKVPSAIADMLEAIVGAVFLDSNFETAQKVIVSLWGKNLTSIFHKEKDSKTQLQEMLQSRSEELPVYKLLEIAGEPHDPLFKVEITTSNISAIGKGHSKKNAEHDAAGKVIKKLKKIQGN